MHSTSSHVRNTLATSILASASNSPRPLRKRRRQDEPEPKPTTDQVPSPPKSSATPDRPVKRAKTRGKPRLCSERIGRTPKFWDTLHPIPLVEAALEELDRRNKLEEDQGAEYDSTEHSSIEDDDLTVQYTTGDDQNTIFNPTRDREVDRRLLHFSRHGGPDLTDLRGISVWEMPRRKDQPTRSSSSGIHKTRAKRGSQSQSGARTSAETKSCSPYDAAFRQNLANWNIYPIDHFLDTGEEPPPPENMDVIITAICNTGRSSLEPEAIVQEKFLEFRKAYKLARSEESVSRTLELIEGMSLALSSAHVKRGPIILNNLFPLLPENLVPGNPDRLYGARPEKLDLSVRDELEHLLLPTKSLDILCPNVVVHIKGPSGNPETAGIQAVYDGALAARGMEALWAYGSSGQDAQAGQLNARTITCTLTHGVLSIYAVYARSGTGNPTLSQLQQMPQQQRWSASNVEYTTSLISAWLVRDRPDDFLKGVTAFRNALEWARQQRDEAITRANRQAEATRQATACTSPSVVEDMVTCGSLSQSSADPITAE
ncbi:hypothetical protein DHEL01_v212744 [Diaporthe helianthi]|uniref:Uncharacterized protein n=1 Tax=Diaporthe helianthi TaxID=158607 RepID=A0A2P5HF44_DIAHE|nr:hypothetical protein DHEL01_v212744 [Diaporthe helianthi]